MTRTHDITGLQTNYYYARERTRGFRDIATDLFKTHDLPRVAGVLDTDALFPDPSRDRLFTIEMSVTPNALGVARVDLGSTAFMRLEANDNDLIIRAGAALAADAVSATIADVLILGKLQRIVMAIKPGTGEVRVWIDGQEVAREQSTNLTFNGPWADGLDGAITVTAPAVLARVEAYVGQIPKHFI